MFISFLALDAALQEMRMSDASNRPDAAVKQRISELPGADKQMEPDDYFKHKIIARTKSDTSFQSVDSESSYNGRYAEASILC